MKREPQDDELLRSYLLGDLPEEDADRLERRLLAEDDLFDLAEAVEADLLAALDRGELAPAERERVLRRLASSPQGRGRLALARSLNTVADETAADRTVVPFPRRAPAFPPPAIHWMALAASLVMLTGLGWFAWQHREQASKAAARVAVQTPPPTPSPLASTPASTPPTANPLVEKTPHSGQGHRAPRKKPRPMPPIAVVVVSLTTTRGAEAEHERLHLSSATETAEIRIDAGDLDETKFYLVVIRKGEEMISSQRLRINPLKGALVVDIQARRLAAGRYEVAVTPEGESEEMTQVFDVDRGTI
jgi:hypothetical protein